MFFPTTAGRIFSRNVQPPEFARLDCCKGVLDLSRSRQNAAQIVGGEFEDRDAATGEILLVTNVLIRRNKEFKLASGPLQQLPVLDAAPSVLLDSAALVTRKHLMHRPWHALVQQDSHAVSRADSDRSNIRQAISRVTDGKQSINSSNE